MAHYVHCVCHLDWLPINVCQALDLSTLAVKKLFRTYPISHIDMNININIHVYDLSLSDNGATVECSALVLLQMQLAILCF